MRNTLKKLLELPKLYQFVIFFSVNYLLMFGLLAFLSWNFSGKGFILTGIAAAVLTAMSVYLPKNDVRFWTKTWIYSGLICGVVMFLVIMIVLPIMEGELIAFNELYKLPVWLIAGLLFYYFESKRG